MRRAAGTCTHMPSKQPTSKCNMSLRLRISIADVSRTCLSTSMLRLRGHSRLIAVWTLLITVGQCSRDDAFAGYEEKISECLDSDAECEKWAKNNQCLENAYYMREKCHKVISILARCYRTFDNRANIRNALVFILAFLRTAVLRSDSRLHAKGVAQALGRQSNCRWDKCGRPPYPFVPAYIHRKQQRAYDATGLT